ncbi:MAG: hypothetical protein IJ324_09595 [Lachnospiraceae bacterium]|nr:hypothetical protein [Lachnospiraceae bacterium]
MDLEKLVNQTVIHKSFGKGIIRSVDEKYLEVDFMEKGKVSKFPYPSCFNGFLIMEDCELQPEITSVVEVWKVESGAVQKEELRHQYEKTMQGIESRRLAAEDKKLKAAQRAMEHRSTYSSTNFNKKK